jgi:hypothetical protein
MLHVFPVMQGRILKHQGPTAVQCASRVLQDTMDPMLDRALALLAQLGRIHPPRELRPSQFVSSALLGPRQTHWRQSHLLLAAIASLDTTQGSDLHCARAAQLGLILLPSLLRPCLVVLLAPAAHIRPLRRQPVLHVLREDTLGQAQRFAANALLECTLLAREGPPCLYAPVVHPIRIPCRVQQSAIHVLPTLRPFPGLGRVTA